MIPYVEPESVERGARCGGQSIAGRPAGAALRQARRSFPFIERIFADAGYQGPRVAEAAANTGSFVKRSEAHKFVILPKRWRVERTFTWASRYRRLAGNFERTAAVAFFRLAMIRPMLRRIARATPSE